MYITFKLNIPNQSIWNPKGSRIWNVWPSLLFKSSFYSILFLWLIFCCHPIFLISHQIYFFCVWQLHLILQAVNDPYLYPPLLLNCIAKLWHQIFLILYSVICLLKLFSGKIQAFHPLWLSPRCLSESKFTEHWSSAADWTTQIFPLSSARASSSLQLFKNFFVFFILWISCLMGQIVAVETEPRI